MLIDTHCHLDLEYFPDGPGEVVERARQADVHAMICIGVGGMGPSRQAVAIAEDFKQIVATVGVHPHDAGRYDAKSDEAEYVSLLEKPRVVAVGEVGLDYHYDHSPREIQQQVFRRFIELAKELKKPLVIHTRNAAEDTLTLLEEHGAKEVGGVIHCFSEDRDFARRALDLGFDLSFSGIVTFKNAVAIQDVAAWAPEDRILVETDSPYLAPIPHRGKKNEPAFVRRTVEKIAELRNTSVERVSEVTTENAIRRFGTLLTQAIESSRVSHN
jgi:TatD DNase family protein